MSKISDSYTALDDRSRDVFRNLVESYLETGDPVGSRTLVRSLSEKVSAATVRNTMQDLEHLGLLDSPHVSAGRIPTQLGLRLFLDGFLEVGEVSEAERREIERSLDSNSSDITAMLDRAGGLL
ncbi:MAG: heat-inducible transcriptional repressor HrcA, partial [Pseudomonadota bacterium]